MPKKRPKILLAQAADLAGVSKGTWSGYVSRGQAPKPVERVGSTPLWDEREVVEWVASRPGQGSRSTKRAKERAAERKRQAKETGSE